MRYLVRIGDQEFTISELDRNLGLARINGQLVHFDFQHVRGSLYSLIIDSKVFTAHLEGDGSVAEIQCGPHLWRAEVDDERTALLRQLARSDTLAAGTFEIKAPMPGLVVRLPVQKGEAVKKGQSLVVIEAMKMENDIKSPADGYVATIHVSERTAVEKNAPLVTLATGAL
ncbi:MAG: biotin/lipoyl-binding protein [candidate division KSB1 bacterium]|nr:biotin/lipoyl-binding protein [candidate division KSB1 bacterium]MDZ7304053.1 biotin/lipoyl-binding protein [candidate division KSB1 bacterium]MDZ7313236.1 biotin/lipoyl-binding protein [candidate division KSB1 bacterium]